MDYAQMSKEELVKRLEELDEYMDNVVVFWGDKRGFIETFKQVAANEGDVYTTQETEHAKIILEKEGAFDEFIELVRDSFERGGINYVISEKISTIMQEVAEKNQ
jgi:hypothetical protein